jgi:uncharacterized protein
MSENPSFRETLESEHDFPGPFSFKVIGPNEPAFASRVYAAFEAVCPDADPAWSRRESAKGRHVSITVDAVVESVDVVLEVYERFRKVEGVKLVL